VISEYIKKEISMKIAVAGLGYVGTSMAILLAQHNQVVAIDLDPARVTAINEGRAPIVDPDCSSYLRSSTPTGWILAAAVAPHTYFQWVE